MGIFRYKTVTAAGKVAVQARLNELRLPNQKRPRGSSAGERKFAM